MNDLENDIISALSKGSLSTTDLATAIGRNRSTVYRKCMQMENVMILTSELVQSERRLFYCPLAEEVLTSDNYDEIMQLIKESDDEDAVLVPFYPKNRVWSLSKKNIIFVPQSK